MPNETIIDPQDYEARPILFGKEEIQKLVPHRFEFALLDGVYQADPKSRIAVGLHEVRNDSFWTRGHIPGRPLMPGVLMVESLAQLCSFFFLQELWKEVGAKPGFMGFGGIDEVRFRMTVTPPGKLILAVRIDQLRPRASQWTAQGFYQGKLAVEGKIMALAV